MSEQIYVSQLPLISQRDILTSSCSAAGRDPPGRLEQIIHDISKDNDFLLNLQQVEDQGEKDADNEEAHATQEQATAGHRHGNCWARACYHS